ncbi:hypothetical protein BJ912DRAFT_949059 [Pholiota molesta]|nr:hypothetical protein BJ912DRAFT_949059 [Pholiota molesta]
MIIQKNTEYEPVPLVSNSKFICGLSYEPTLMEVKGEEICKESNVFKVYQNEESSLR